jgi:hypothetical protein
MGAIKIEANVKRVYPRSAAIALATGKYPIRSGI